MEILPITEVYCREGDGEMVDTGVIIGYKAIGINGITLGQGETIAEATDSALIAMYLPETTKIILTKSKFRHTLRR